MTDHNRTADGPVSLDSNTIVDRGRGPEIAGTRITAYTIMDFLKSDDPRPEIAGELSGCERIH